MQYFAGGGREPGHQDDMMEENKSSNARIKKVFQEILKAVLSDKLKIVHGKKEWKLERTNNENNKAELTQITRPAIKFTLG